ncbi:hypothetical protein ADUPG1_013344 [Aduncisulcus paluster]|uniref:Uncharacterized protein n=1 Tax=Aduncisulcus paluster TaxID=2918883 RepID=A0ABQ5K2L5_9EUKA|nr:hypothetical protein ADUPG1_013344 [Aduncisulcus paluster]
MEEFDLEKLKKSLIDDQGPQNDFFHTSRRFKESLRLQQEKSRQQISHQRLEDVHSSIDSFSRSRKQIENSYRDFQEKYTNPEPLIDPHDTIRLSKSTKAYSTSLHRSPTPSSPEQISLSLQQPKRKPYIKLNTNIHSFYDDRRRIYPRESTPHHHDTHFLQKSRVPSSSFRSPSVQASLLLDKPGYMCVSRPRSVKQKNDNEATQKTLALKRSLRKAEEKADKLRNFLEVQRRLRIIHGEYGEYGRDLSYSPTSIYDSERGTSSTLRSSKQVESYTEYAASSRALQDKAFELVMAGSEELSRLLREVDITDMGIEMDVHKKYLYSLQPSVK